jgi:PAS domain S-box-containing protein
MGFTDMAHEHRGDPLGITSAAVALVDAYGLIQYWSRRAQALLGYSAAGVLRRPVTSLLASEEALSSALAEGRRVGDGWESVVTARHCAGHRIELALRACPLRTGEGSSWLFVACDISASHKWEQEQTVMGRLLEWAVTAGIVGDAEHSGHGEDRVPQGMEDLLRSHPPPVTTSAGESGQTAPAPSGQGTPLLLSAPVKPTFGLPATAREGKTLAPRPTSAAATPRDGARERLALINEAGHRIGSTLDLDCTVNELAEVLVPQLADFVAIDLFQGGFASADLTTGSATGGTLTRAAHLSIHKDLPEVVVAIGEPTRYPPRSPQQRCLKAGQSVLDAVLAPTTSWLTEDPLRLEILRRLGVHSHLTVPLIARGVTMGVVTLLRWENPNAFDEDDLLLIEELVARAAVCVDNARRFAREHNAALTLQTSLLPPDLPDYSAVEIAYRYLPADAEAGVGGDWFDVIPLSGARVALVVGDVIGHGIHAAASMGRLRAAVQTLADLDLPPDELLAQVDDLVLRLADEAEAATDGPLVIGATCVYAVYDPISRKLNVARAGHPSPAIAHLREPVEFPDIPAGPPLGLGGLPFESAEIEVEEGSVIALYTDGLIEASDRDVDVGFERLCFALAHPDRPLEEICDTMVRTLLPDHPHDDVAFLIARTHILTSDRFTSWEVPADPRAVHEVRGKAARQLTAWGLERLAFTTELIVSELVTNAIRHASGPIGLRLIRDRTLICEVSDASNTAPHMRRSHVTDEGGRGLFLVAQVAQRWGTRYTATGKTVWAELQLPVAHASRDARPSIGPGSGGGA